MKQYTILVAAITVLAILSGCDRPTEADDPTTFDSSIDGISSPAGGGLSAGMLGDQSAIASRNRKPADVVEVPKAPETPDHLKNTGIGTGGVGTGTGTDTGTGTGDTGAGDGTTTGTGTGTDTGTTTGTDGGTGGGSALDGLDGVIPPAKTE